MAKSGNQKLKLLYLMQYLLSNSDEANPLTVVNNLNTFIFGLIRAVGLFLLGRGICRWAYPCNLMNLPSGLTAF